MSKALDVFAGKTAFAQIQKNGLNSEQFKLLVGASGGPKWFVLAGLDRFFCGDFFKDRNTPLHTLGSSAGAWRFSCYGQQDPLAAINRLIDGYSTLTYPTNANTRQVTEQSEKLLHHILGDNGAAEICSNPNIKNTIIVAKSYGLSQFNSPLLQLPGLITSAVANRISRRNLSLFFQRVIFTTTPNDVPFNYLDGIASKVVEFSKDNVELSLQATGAIPLVIEGVKDIPGAGRGMYRDGGIIDYHFDQPFLANNQALSIHTGNDLVLYPHFYNEFKPGWFDKFVSKRFANPKNFDNVVILSPSKSFVDSLPYKKIPDRTDFKELTETQRINYWQRVIKESERLADEFNELCHHHNPTSFITPL